MSMISAQIDELRKAAEYYDGSEVAIIMRHAADTIWQLRDDLQRTNTENAELREQMERLVTLLRVDCDIDASWDGLRRFWSIGLTENGCLMRDRACKAEAENAKLRELVEDMHAALQAFCDAQDVHGDNCPLWVERTDDCELRGIERSMREFGVEVDDA